ncbi:alpha/beta hydrolase family protein [Pedobacter africanus]|nr:prolyl oligopeptidase family serine peptidase [Pedobacter africanus]
MLVYSLNGIAQNGEEYLFKAIAVSGKPAMSMNTLITPVDQIGEFSAISRNGRYCSYVINGLKDYTIVQSIEGKWKHKLKGMKPGFFSGDNRYYIYQTGDSLCYLPLNGKAIKVITGVASYQLPHNDNRNEWLGILLMDKKLLLRNLLTGKEYQFNRANNPVFSMGNKWFSCKLDNADKELAVINLANGKLNSYVHVTAYSFDESKRVLILQTEEGAKKRLQWIDAANGKVTTIWKGNKDEMVIGKNFDKAAQQLIFILQTQSSRGNNSSIWYYKKGMNLAVQKKPSDLENKIKELTLSGVPTFTDDGRYIIVSMRKSVVDGRKARVGAVQVNVWNYQDTFLMSAQLAGGDHRLSKWQGEIIYKFSMPSEERGQISNLSGEHETLYLEGIREYGIIERRVMTDRFWEDWAVPEVHIVSLLDGKRIRLKKGIMLTRFAPDGTWLLCYDRITGQYLRYDMRSEKYTDLSAKAAVYFGGEIEFDGTGKQAGLPRGIVGWLDNGKCLLVYDHYDIWQLDISGKKEPVNLTNGRKDKIRFEITPDEFGDKKMFYNAYDRLILTAVNMENKDNGFYALNLGRHKGAECLAIGPYMFDLERLEYGGTFWGRYSRGRRPIKARDADMWLVVRQSTTEAPNFYVSQGLKTFKALTNLNPHKDYNWLNSELVNFKQQDGSASKGILYKPENFDPAKKYPVLIHYYDQFSMCLNQYPVNDYTVSGYINIPWFVSRGYLVFLPDIYFNKGADGNPGMKEKKIPYGEAALNAVEGAANWLAGQAYVDSTKMGIAGHSMGGGLTSYILTHSKRFAAAFMGAGVTDWVSSALQLAKDDGMSRLGVSYYSGEKGADIWLNNEKYLDNPILHVAEVTSPLLMFHCKDDSGVPFEQAVELFVAMRRMGKRAWLLQYDHGGHSTDTPEDCRDLTIRATQFFDHYLKGALAPIWMTRGVRAQFKGIETGYEFDQEIKTPADVKFKK